MKIGQTVGVDFGTSNLFAYIKESGRILYEPMIAAAERGTTNILAIGREAQEKMREFPEKYDAVYPVRGGLIFDYPMASSVLRIFLKKICGKQVLKPRVVTGIPIRAGEVAERAMLNAALDAGALSVLPLREPFAAATGMGLDVSDGKSIMVIDIGGGTTDVSILSMGKVALGTSTEAAGKKMDMEISRYIRTKTGIEVGERTAEQIKINGGCLMPQKTDDVLRIHGRDLETGLPASREVPIRDFPEVLRPVAEEIADAAKRVLERAPREIRAEIEQDGIYLTGGGSATSGLDAYLTERLNIPCRLVKNPLHSVAIGAGLWE